jgi:hypothetical protein
MLNKKQEYPPINPKVRLLRNWQGIELLFGVAFFAITFLMYAFSGNKGIAQAWSILWKFMLLKAAILYFFIKKYKWAVLFNVVENSLSLLFIGYAIYYTLVYGNHENRMSLFLVCILLVALGLFFIFLIRAFINYYKYLNNN